MRYSRDPHTAMDHCHHKNRVKKENQSWKKKATSNSRTIVTRKSPASRVQLRVSREGGSIDSALQKATRKARIGISRGLRDLQLSFCLLLKANDIKCALFGLAGGSKLAPAISLHRHSLSINRTSSNDNTRICSSAVTGPIEELFQNS